MIAEHSEFHSKSLLGRPCVWATQVPRCEWRRWGILLQSQPTH